MIQILIPSGLQVCITALSKPLGRKGKHACFSKADAKVVHFFHICKFFAKKHAFFAIFAQFLQNNDYKQGQLAVKNKQNGLNERRRVTTTRRLTVLVKNY